MYKLLLSALLWLGVAVPAAAETWRDWSGLAFDQAVLSHRMTKSACLVMLDGSSDIHVDGIFEASERFLLQMEALDTLPEGGSNAALIEADLKTLSAAAEPLVPSARQIAAGDLHAVPVRLMLEANLIATRQFVVLSGHAPRGTGAAHIESAVILAHGLRVTSQRVLRDLCLLQIGLGHSGLRAEMTAALPEFDLITEALINGDFSLGVEQAPNVQIKLRLRAVQKKWSTLSGLIEGALETGDIDVDDILLTSVMAESVLKSLDEIIARYGAL